MLKLTEMDTFELLVILALVWEFLTTVIIFMLRSEVHNLAGAAVLVLAELRAIVKRLDESVPNNPKLSRTWPR